MNNISAEPSQLNDVLNGRVKPNSTDSIDKEPNTSEKINNNQQVDVKELKPEPISKKQLEELAVKLQEFVGDLDKSLRFETHQESGRDVVKVLDGESGDLIKQFPSEELLGIITNLSKASGLLVNEKI